MIEVIIVCEGQTEQTFVGDVLAPFLAERHILQPRIIPTSGWGQGGALSGDRVMRYLRNTLRERGDTYVTTLFDLYGLKTDFPGLAAAAASADPLDAPRPSRLDSVRPSYKRPGVFRNGSFRTFSPTSSSPFCSPMSDDSRRLIPPGGRTWKLCKISGTRLRAPNISTIVRTRIRRPV